MPRPRGSPLRRRRLARGGGPGHSDAAGADELEGETAEEAEELELEDLSDDEEVELPVEAPAPEEDDSEW